MPHTPPGVFTSPSASIAELWLTSSKAPVVTAAQHSSSDVPIASDAAREPQALLPSARRPQCPWPEPMEETMRVTKRAVAAREQSWPLYFAGSRANLQNIRRALARPELRSLRDGSPE